MQRLQNEKLLWTLSRKLLKSVFGDLYWLLLRTKVTQLHEQTALLKRGFEYFKRCLFTV